MEIDEKYMENLNSQEIIFYKTNEGKVKVEILIHSENLWLSQARIAELFEVDRSVVTKHIKNIFNDGELVQEAVCAKIAHTASDGKKNNTMFYNLDMIIAVGYRVNSKKQPNLGYGLQTF